MGYGVCWELHSLALKKSLHMGTAYLCSEERGSKDLGGLLWIWEVIYCWTGQGVCRLILNA